jgi:hypothetical protein
MRKDLLQKREQAAAAKAAEAERQKNKDPHSLQKIDLKERRSYERYGKAENALGIDSSIIEQQYFTMKLIKYKTLCGNLSTQEGRWTITTLI